MRTLIDFFGTLLRMPVGWVVWVGILGLVNGAAIAFLPRVEALVVLGAMMLGLVIQLTIFHSQGFVRLLGLAHFPWLVMLPWLLTRFDPASPSGPFQNWLLAVLAIDGFSLLIDVTDVARYLMGDRDPAVPSKVA